MAADKQKLRGYMNAVILGMRYIPHYDPSNPPRPNCGDIFHLERELSNPFVPNALLVKHNSRRIGYIAREQAAVLAPLLDDRTISVRGIVTAYRRSQSDKSFPCQILVFSATRSFPLNFQLRSTTPRDGFALNLRDDSNYNLRKFDEWAVASGRGGTQGMNASQQDNDVPPPVQVPPPTPVQAHQPAPPPVQVQQPSPTPAPPPVQVRQPSPAPAQTPVQVQQPSPTGGRQEETGASRVFEHCSVPSEETVRKPSLVKTIVSKGYTLGRAHFWPPEVTDLGS